MKSTVKTHFTCPVEVAVQRMTVKLWDAGCQVQGTPIDWRVLMFRRDSQIWTQAHHGLTAGGKSRDWIRWSGPEVGLVKELNLERV